MVGDVRIEISWQLNVLRWGKLRRGRWCNRVLMNVKSWIVWGVVKSVTEFPELPSKIEVADKE